MAEENSEEETPKASGGGLMSILPLAVIAAAGTFGMVWYASEPAEQLAACEAREIEEIDPEELQARTADYITLDTITVSLPKEAGAKHLRMTLALGVPKSTHLTDVQTLRLRDRFLERLRTVDTTLLMDPMAMPALKQALLAQAQSTLGSDAVYSILITDFLMK